MAFSDVICIICLLFKFVSLACRISHAKKAEYDFLSQNRIIRVLFNFRISILPLVAADERLNLYRPHFKTNFNLNKH